LGRKKEVKKMKKILVFALATILMVGLLVTGCAAPSTPTSQTPTPTPSERVLKVAGNFGNVPWVFKEGGKNTGFEYEMVEEVAKRMGAKVEWTDLQFSGILPGLLAGKWDAAASSIFVTKKRAEEFDYADPYYASDTSLCVKKDSPIKSFEDMKGKIFGAESGSSNDAWLKEMLPQYGPFEIKGYDRIQDAMLDLIAGRIDGVVGDLPTVEYYIKDKPDLEVRLKANKTFMQAVFFRKGDPLRDEFNKYQNELKQDGTLAQIYRKWFGKDPDPDSPTVKVFTTPYVPEQ
jgi:ABC-type amino acid transport substrate-binding protein